MALRKNRRELFTGNNADSKICSTLNLAIEYLALCNDLGCQQTQSIMWISCLEFPIHCPCYVQVRQVIVYTTF